MIWLEVDPEIAKPGWINVAIVVILFAAVFFLWRSMRKLLRTMDPDLPHEADLVDDGADLVDDGADLVDDGADLVDDGADGHRGRPDDDGPDVRPGQRQSVTPASSPVSPI
ncbi:hypothetical protein [Microlunatus sp. Y2014]|uniref:hypothetical protein n=1 Tax=Microlunatus sp. Y2014 TaxID=3418488 RepID=UPI003DA7A433